MSQVDPIVSGLRRFRSIDEPSPEAEAWAACLGREFAADLGLLACFGVAGLSEDGQRIPLCAADAAVMLLTRSAFQRHQDLAIALPPGPTVYPLLLSAKLLLGSMLEDLCSLSLSSEGVSPFRLPEGHGILIVSPSIEMRSRYAATTVSAEPLLHKFPGFRLKPDGSAVRITKTADYAQGASTQPLCFFLARQRNLPKEVGLSTGIVLVDFLHGQWGHRAEEVLTWARTIADLQDPPARLVVLIPLEDDACRSAVESAQLQYFPVDADALTEARTAFAVTLRNRSQVLPGLRTLDGWSLSQWDGWDPFARIHRVQVINGTEPLIERLQGLFALLEREHQNDSRDFRVIRWLMALLGAMSVPIPWYERATRGRTVWSLIEGLGHYGLEPSLRLGEVVRSAKSRLKACYDLLEQENPKSEALVSTLRGKLDSLEGNGRLGVIVRDRVMAEALRAWLYTSEVNLRDARLTIRCHAEWVPGEVFDDVVIPGIWPARFRWQLAGRVGHAMSFLVYPGEERVLGLQLRRVFGQDECRTRSEQRTAAASRLSGTGTTRMSPLAASVERPQSTHPAVTLALGPPIPFVSKRWAPPPIDEEPEAISASAPPWMEEWTGDDVELTVSAGADALALARATRDYAYPLNCIETRIRGRGDDTASWLYLPDDQTSDVLTPDSEDLLACANVDLEPGMTLIGTDDGRRRDLFDHLMELADATPDLRPMKALQESWREAIDVCAAQFRDKSTNRIRYDDLLKALKRAGAPITDQQAVRLWVSQKVLGPEDMRSIEAVGKLAAHPILADSARLVHEALKSLRGVRTAMGRRLSAALRNAAVPPSQPGSPKGRSGNRLKGKTANLVLSVPLEELVDAMEFWHIDEVDLESRPVPPSIVGQLLPTPWEPT